MNLRVKLQIFKQVNLVNWLLCFVIMQNWGTLSKELLVLIEFL